LVCIPAFAASSEPEGENICHEVWGIPWGASPEQFCKTAQELYGISFVVFNYTLSGGDDDPGTPFAYYSSLPEHPIRLFNYPVVIEALFAPPWSEDVFYERADGEMGLISVTFEFWLSHRAMLSAWPLADDVFHKLYCQYGEPWIASFERPYERRESDYFAMPIKDKRLDIQRIFEHRIDAVMYGFSAYFDNIEYNLRAGEIYSANRYGNDVCVVTLEFTAPRDKGGHFWGILKTIDSPEDSDVYNYYLNISVDPRIDIDLW